ncbi:DEAD/DEAH box helicase family protein [Massiliimalia timonensis]|uniref:DEAD/DEAH box helicase family protein n=1 Tax=Massiliimalia timonensis TaxID=1987501 RepID=UPI00189E41B5|nr:DEAD/DEAH box helicase family protein [Massiliimalia timonensis]
MIKAKKEIVMDLKGKYLKEDEKVNEVLSNAVRDNQITLIVSPQGTGKSEWVKSLPYNKAFVSPTISTANQIENDVENISVARGCSFLTFEMTLSDAFGTPLYGNVSITFGSAQSVKYIEDVDVLVVDEIHKLVQYSTFGYSNCQSVLNAISQFYDQGKKIVLLTAPPTLLDCIQHLDFMEKLDTYIKICKDKEYVSECIMLKNLFNRQKMINLIQRNSTGDNFQIALYNDTKAIKDIAENLNEYNIKALSVNGLEYKENTNHKKELIEDIKKGNYHGYDALLCTSWVDVGLNFLGTNITHMYCVFDNNYDTGDLTLIEQFMARSRRSKPILYISKPTISKEEQKLLEHFTDKPIKFEKEILQHQKEVANTLIEEYKQGYIKDIDTKQVYGIYKLDYEKREEKYHFSDITLKYQLFRIFEKWEILNDFSYLKQRLKVQRLVERNDTNELSTVEIQKLKDVLEKMKTNIFLKKNGAI